MKTIDLKTHVSAAVAVRWDEFAERHPALAGVIDPILIIENVSDLVANDPEYQQAMTDVRAATAGVEAVEAVVGVVDRAVVKFIGRLL